MVYEHHPLVGRDAGPIRVLDYGEADAAAGPGMHTIQLAEAPTPIDDENVDHFCDRWAAHLARAAGQSQG